MADKVYPSAKPVPPAPATTTTTNATFPANKAQLYNANRPAYRPQPPPRRGHRRSCWCACCLWLTLLIILVVFLAAIAAAVFYVLYRPHRPSFTVTSLQLSRFNLTDTALTSNFNVTVLARNRNSKISFDYDPIDVKFVSGGVEIGDGQFAAFTHGRKNVTTLRSVVRRSGGLPDGTDVSRLRSEMRSRNLAVRVQLDTKVKVRVGKIDTKKVAIRVTCDGIRISVPNGRTASSGTTSNVKCKVDPRVKIIRWTF